MSALRVSNNAITDAGVASIAGLPLRIAELDSTNITDKALEHLPLKDLEELNLSRTAITDRGLATLAKCESLRMLTINDCPKITPRAAKALMRKIPECQIEFVNNPDGL